MKTVKISIFCSVISLLLTVFQPLFAQKGEYYLTHYHPEDDKISNENFALLQDAKGQMRFANAKGVLKFDGRFWELTKTPSSALSLALDSLTKIVYVGCLNNFGFIITNENGKDVYYPIFHAKEEYISISKIVVTTNYVYFQGDGILFEFDKSKSKISHVWKNSNRLSFENIFAVNNKLFITDSNNGTFIVVNGKITRFKSNFPISEKVVFATNTHLNTVFIGTNASKFYTFNGTRFNKTNFIDSAYIKSSLVVDGLILDDSKAIIATAKGGCLLIDLTNGKTISIINYYTGLADNEVFAIAKDKHFGVWIAHELGLTRLDYFLPFKNFSTYPGIEGRIQQATSFNNQLFVASSEGVFYLDEVKNMADVIKYVKPRSHKKINVEDNKLNSFVDNQKKRFLKLTSFFRFRKKKKNEETILPETKKSDQQVDTLKKKKRGFLGLFKRKKDKEVENNKQKDEFGSSKQYKAKRTNKKITANKLINKRIVNQKTAENFELHSVKYVFKKISGIYGKCTQLQALDGKLLVASNQGLYEITDKKAKLILPKVISYIYVDNITKRVYVSTDENKLYCYQYELGNLKLDPQIFYLPDNITNIYQENFNHLWLCSHNSIFKLNLNSNALDTFKINNPFSEDIFAINIQNKAYFLTSNKVFAYDSIHNSLIENTTLLGLETENIKRIHAENNIVWMSNNQIWSCFSKYSGFKTDFTYLKLIKDISSICINNKNSYWIITKNNQLYRVEMDKKSQIKNSSNIFLQKAVGNDGHFLPISQLIVQENESKVAFHFASPEFLDNSSLQYQYKLKGLNENWSDWSNENQVVFSYLPSGNFELIIRTKNSLDKITESAPIRFKVKPPYWQEWWFYLLEFLFFGTLLFISIILNRSTHKNLWVSRVLTFITIVMLLELISTIAESYIYFNDSPVINFLFQVFLAIMIFPFERILSSFIQKNQ
jgi:ligand-binding sensor domain-containing protein